MNFKSFIGRTGDCYDRFLIRIREMLESVYIIYQLLPNFLSTNNTGLTDTSTFDFLKFQINIGDELYSNANFNTKMNSMETLIEHFKYYSEGIKVSAGAVYEAVEAPKGEFGVVIISDGSTKPYRCKIRTPAYHHLQLMSFIMEGHYFADMITILGSQDIVFGEVDR